MIEWAAPGRRVVCITDWPPFTLNQAQKLGARVPMHGQIYRIREAMRSGCSNDDSESILLMLCEIIRSSRCVPVRLRRSGGAWVQRRALPTRARYEH